LVNVDNVDLKWRIDTKQFRLAIVIGRIRIIPRKKSTRSIL